MAIQTELACPRDRVAQARSSGARHEISRWDPLGAVGAGGPAPFLAHTGGDSADTSDGAIPSFPASAIDAATQSE
jgi:hypothetical protein